MADRQLPESHDVDLPVNHDVDLPVDHEIDLRGIVVFFAGLTAVSLLTFLVIWGMLRLFEHEATGRDPVATPIERATKPSLPPEPRLESSPPANLAELRHEEESTLKGWGWVDEAHGVARIPVARAIDLLAEKPLPSRTAAPAESK